MDTTAPAQPSITTTTSLTNDSTPAIEGVAEAGSTVTLFVDGETTGVTATADGTTGAFTISPSSSLSDGTHNLSVTATDIVGNVSVFSITFGKGLTMMSNEPKLKHPVAFCSNLIKIVSLVESSFE